MLQLLLFMILTLSCLILLIKVPYHMLEGLEALVIIGFLVGLVGTIGTSIEKDITSEWIEMDVHVSRTPRMVIVDDGSKLWEFKEYFDVNNINDSTVFEFEHTTNIFGIKDIEGIRYKNK